MTGGLPLGRVLGVPLVLTRPAAAGLGAVALTAALARGPAVALPLTAGLAAALAGRDLARTAAGAGFGRFPRVVPVAGLLPRYGWATRGPGEEAALALAGPVALAAAAGLAAVGAAATGGPPHRVLAPLTGALVLAAVVDLLPGPPTDGGRLLRAAVWSRTGSRVAGTRVAAVAGRVTAVLVALVTLSSLTAGDPAETALTFAVGGPLAVALARGAIRPLSRRPRAGRPRTADLALALGLAVLATALLRAYVVRTFSVDSASMQATLRPGDHVLAERVSYRVHGVRRGDLVVLHRPPGTGIPENDLVKRVIGLPGERVEARAGTVSVDGVPLREPYARPGCVPAPVAPVLVPPGHLWVLGDDRCGSTDSRKFGPVPVNLVTGRIVAIVWPPGRTGRF